MKRTIWGVILLVYGLRAFAYGLPENDHIIVTGNGYVERVPDYAEVRLLISMTSESMKESKRYVDTLTADVIDAVTEKGISAEDIIASKIVAQPRNRWTEGDIHHLGEQVSRGITLFIRYVDRYSEFVQAVVDTGVTEFEGITLGFDNLKEMERAAMEIAIRDAVKKAEVIAAQIGRRLGDVFRISEGEIRDSAPFYQEIYTLAAEVSSPGEPAALKIRKQRIEDSIHVVFTLE